MIINISGSQFPKAFIEEIEAKGGSMSYIALVFPSEFSDSLNPRSLKELTDCLERKEKEETPLTETKEMLKKDFTISLVYSADGLDPETVKIILGNKYLRNKIATAEFTKLIASSAEATSFALGNEEIMHQLNNIDPKVDSQTFSRSCAARCIMNLLIDHNLLDESKATRSEELRIYKEIWYAPGETATPEKMVQYLKTHFGSQVQGLEVEDVLSRAFTYLDSQGPEASALIHSGHALFREAIKENLIKVTSKGMEESEFKPNTSYLLIVGEPPGATLHVLFAKTNTDNNKFEVTDPADSELPKPYDSFLDFINQNEKFLGIGLSVKQSPAV